MRYTTTHRDSVFCHRDRMCISSDDIFRSKRRIHTNDVGVFQNMFDIDIEILRAVVGRVYGEDGGGR